MQQSSAKLKQRKREAKVPAKAAEASASASVTLIEPCRRHLHGNYTAAELRKEKRKIKQRWAAASAAVRQVTSGSLGEWLPERKQRIENLKA